MRPPEVSRSRCGTTGGPGDGCLPAGEYDSAAGRLDGNFPQAFSHAPLVVTAMNVDERAPRVEGRVEGVDAAEGNR